jgi:CBS domain-containing protein
MKVKDIMVSKVTCCGPETNLAAATELFWAHDCGILPVIDQGRIVGVITDRDVCIALGTKNVPASDVAVGSVMSGKAFVCKTDDDVKTALETMKKQRIRRLPVTDEAGNVVGILSLDDVVREAQKGERELSYSDVVNTYKALFERQIAVRGGV